uniref:Efflux RND transporter permease subunit n=1 Tax=Eiseniibacteriota bacterium TaxID=2212470 RepID=A0A832ML44_UNCEI
MKLSEISIERPVLATVMSLAILLFGGLSYTLLPVREYPDIDSPVVSVTTFYRGANPQVVETEITDVLEEQISTIEGVNLITSSSQEQVSRITVEFNLRRDVDQAANDVRDRVSRVRGALPSGVDEPVVAKQDVNAQPIMWISLAGERWSGLELSDVASNVLAERLQRIEGVGAVFVGGNRQYAMRVWLDPQRLAAHGLSVADVERALRAENAEIPSGRVEGRGREFSVRTRGDLTRAEEFASIVVSQQGTRPVRLGDVAEVRLGAEDERSIARYNGVPSVGLGIVKQQKASTVDVARNVRAALPELRALLPQGMELQIAFDSSRFIEDSMHEVAVALAIAVLLVFIVIFVFLGSMRATLIPAVAIPVSIVGTFTATYFLGFTINILTLLALVLAIGLVVDDAIVMLENIYRHMEMGKSRMRAAIDGAREIGFAIVSTTLALVAVFVPVAFLSGRVGRLFNEFGIAVAVSVLLSGFVALTLTPMLCSRMLRRDPLGHGAATGEDDLEAARALSAARGWRGAFERGWARFQAAYAATLRFAVHHRRLVVLSALAVTATIAVFFRVLPSELVPTEDRGLIFNIVLAPEGATLEYTDRYVRMAEDIYRSVPEVEAMFTAIGLSQGGGGRVTDGFMFVRLKDYAERKRSQQQVVASVFPMMMGIPGVLAIPINPPSLGGGFGRPVQFVLQAETYDELQRSVGLMLAEAQQLGYLVNLDTDLKLNKPQLEVEIDRDRAAALGVSVSEIGSTLQALLGGREATRFKLGNRQYDVILQMPPRDRSSPAMIDGLHVRGKDGLVQLASVTRVVERVSPRELNHFNRVRSATINANLVPGATIGRAIADLRDIAGRVLPPGVRTDLAGESREFAESSTGLYFLFVVALVFIYLVLAAQFESFVHPLTILLSVPLAVFGALLTLFLFGMSLNIYSQIGLIMLIGLVTKNAILIVEYANQRRERGLATVEAVVGAAQIRLRPILMTTLSTVFGVLPIALGLGAGAESRKPLGWAVVGGMIASTFLTLVVVPVVYTYLARFSPVRARTEAEADTEAGAALPAGAPAVPAR